MGIERRLRPHEREGQGSLSPSAPPRSSTCRYLVLLSLASWHTSLLSPLQTTSFPDNAHVIDCSCRIGLRATAATHGGPILLAKLDARRFLVGLVRFENLMDEFFKGVPYAHISR